LNVDPALERAARLFADDVSELLNGTITHGVRLTAVIAHRKDAPPIMQIAYGISRNDPRARVIPLTLGNREAHAFLWVAYFLQLDPEERYAAVTKSGYGLYLDENRTQMLVHWDYDRVPSKMYPAAHVQVNAESAYFETLCRLARERLGKDCPDRELRDAHFPVGGRRFRPSLEDVVEFLVVEELVDARPDWRNMLDSHRQQWDERQLRAAVRRNPDVAIEQLQEDGRLPAQG
jgi:hypothetical protein